MSKKLNQPRTSGLCDVNEHFVSKSLNISSFRLSVCAHKAGVNFCVLCRWLPSERAVWKDLWTESLLHGIAWRWINNKWLHVHLREILIELDELFSTDKRADNTMGYKWALSRRLQLPFDEGRFIENIIGRFSWSDLWSAWKTSRVICRRSNSFNLLFHGSWSYWDGISWSETNFIAIWNETGGRWIVNPSNPCELQYRALK